MGIKNRNIKKKLILFNLIMIVFTISIRPVSVFAENDIVIDLKEIDDSRFIKSDIDFDVWPISEDIFTDEEVKERIGDYNALERNALDERYPDHFTTEKTDSEGRVELKDLKAGTYYVREKSSPNEDIHITPFFISLTGQFDKVYPKVTYDGPSAKLIKVDEEKHVLGGAVFELYRTVDKENIRVPLKDNAYDEHGDEDVLLVTDKNGEIEIRNLPAGTYMFKEVEAPKGYRILTAETRFDVKADETTIVTIVNRKTEKGGIDFRKYDGDTNKALQGATFKVTRYNERDKTYTDVLRDGKPYTLTSDKDGLFSVSDLDYGVYYLMEIKAPTGYERITEALRFEVNENSSSQRVEIKNYKKPKTPGKIPDTGDMTLIVGIAGGLLLIFLGIGIVKKNAKN